MRQTFYAGSFTFAMEISDLNEICQGGPEVGTITINGIEISDRKFIWPPVPWNDGIIIPEYVSAFLGYKFSLCKIDHNFNISIISKKFNFLRVSKILGDTVVCDLDAMGRKFKNFCLV